MVLVVRFMGQMCECVSNEQEGQSCQGSSGQRQSETGRLSTQAVCSWCFFALITLRSVFWRYLFAFCFACSSLNVYPQWSVHPKIHKVTLTGFPSPSVILLSISSQEGKIWPWLDCFKSIFDALLQVSKEYANDTLACKNQGLQSGFFSEENKR